MGRASVPVTGLIGFLHRFRLRQFIFDARFENETLSCPARRHVALHTRSPLGVLEA